MHTWGQNVGGTELKIMKVVVFAAMLLLLQGATLILTNQVKASSNSLNYPGNYALSFDGNLSYVDFGASTLFRPSALSIEAWVKPLFDIELGSNSTSAYGHQWGTIAHCDIMESWVGRYNGWWFGFDYSQGVLEFEFRDPLNYGIVVHANKNFWNSSSWYFVAVTFNNTLYSGNTKFYVNGTLDSQQDMQYQIDYYAPYSPMQVGAISDYTDATRRCAYGGLIDEFRLWNVSRTDSQIQYAWNRTLLGAETSDPDLMGYWRFDDASGTHAADSSSYAATNMGILLPTTNLPQWLPGAPIIPEFSSLSLMIILVMAGCLCAFPLARRLRKLDPTRAR